MTQDLPTVAIVITAVVTITVANKIGLTNPMVTWTIFALAGVGVVGLWAVRYIRYQSQRARQGGEA